MVYPYKKDLMYYFVGIKKIKKIKILLEKIKFEKKKLREKGEEFNFERIFYGKKENKCYSNSLQ